MKVEHFNENANDLTKQFDPFTLSTIPFAFLFFFEIQIRFLVDVGLEYISVIVVNCQQMKFVNYVVRIFTYIVRIKKSHFQVSTWIYAKLKLFIVDGF